MSKGARPDNTPVVLLVLDGWGYRPESEGNAIELGETPVWHRVADRFPSTLLAASGRAVGLPSCQMGNSEVGHTNLGAGRVVDQDIVRISESMDSGAFGSLPAMTQLCQAVNERGGTLHLIGLIGTGGVHAVHRHWVGALEAAARLGVGRVRIHAFLDGRDSPPTSGADFMTALLAEVDRTKAAGVDCQVSTAVGRYFAMDRDRRWPRIKLAYDAMVHGTGHRVVDPADAIREAYDRGETDEFVKPLVFPGADAAGTIRDGDAVFCLNFRADRMRQIVRAIALDAFDGFERPARPSVDLVTMTEYDATFGLPVAFAPTTITRMVAEVIADAGMTQFRTAETEKYAHVTYFFNCGIETPFPGEVRTLVPSQQVATYDLAPEMSAHGITDELCGAIRSREYDFILCNYANGDMVGHTGVVPATVRAVETVDQCLDRVIRSAEETGAILMITADHGNCEMMVDPESGGPHTAHTTNPVPFVMIGDGRVRTLRGGARLADVGPTILNLLDLDVPASMDGHDLRNGVDND